MIIIQRKINLLFLHRSKSLGLIDEFHFAIKSEWLKRGKLIEGIDLFYQTHPSLLIRGVRPTISRFNNYGLYEQVTPDTIALDIGCNTGFFSFYVSRYVKHLDSIELDSTFYKIANLTKEYLEIKNVELINVDIKLFKTTKKYDLVMSFAIHGWVGIPLNEYLTLLKGLISRNGIIIIESHISEEDKKNLKESINQVGFHIVRSGTTDDHLGDERVFYVLK
jgi:SAM-dependent methyltransferase